MKIARKSVTGMTAYQDRWPGDVVMVGVTARTDSSVGIGGEWIHADDLPFRTHFAGTLSEALAEVHADIALAPHHPDFEVVLDLPIPAVLISEIPARDALIPLLEERPSVVSRARIMAGSARYERQLRQLAKRANGLQCNGWSAWEGYARFSPSPMVFYDTRLTRAQVDAALSEDRVQLPDGKIRLAFSGRYVTGKGPSYALRLHDVLRDRGIAHSLTLVGDGPLTEALHAAAAEDVDFLTPMDFDDAWVPWVRNNVDVMVLPHIQGDPSGTYLESSGLGIPVLGFDNTALRNLVSRFNLGWTAPLRDVDALANVVQQLAHNPEQIAERGAHGQRFMQEHHFDAEFDRRIEHLTAIVST